ncbi:hypothetical protein ABK040_015709 [Willaertia magna]
MSKQFLFLCSSKDDEFLKLFNTLPKQFNFIEPFKTNSTTKELIIKIVGGVSTFYVFLTSTNQMYILNKAEEIKPINFLFTEEKIIDISCLSDDLIVLTNLGNVYSSNCSYEEPMFTKINFPLKEEDKEMKIKSIFNGEQCSFVITTCNKLMTWGNNHSYQMGLEELNLKVENPIEVNGFEPPLQNGELVIDVVSDMSFTFFLTSLGYVYSCGEKPVIGHDDLIVKLPRRIKSLENEFVTSIKAGHNTALLLTRDYKVYLLGINYLQKQTPNNNLPINITSNILGNNYDCIKKIHCGNNHYVFVTANGKVLVAGSNRDDQLGIGEDNTEKHVEYAKEVKFSDNTILLENNMVLNWSVFGNFNSTFLLGERVCRDLILFFNKLKDCTVNQNFKNTDISIKAYND